MKAKNIVLFLFGAQVLTSCTVFSVHPLYTQQDLVVDNQLNGTWRDENNANTFYRIESGKDSSYLLTWWEAQDTIWYEAYFLRLNNRYYLDLYPASYNTQLADQLLQNYVPVHSFLQLDLSDDQVIAYMFDGEKMMDLFKRNRIRLRHELLEDYVLITASTEDLQKFIIKYAENREVFSDPAYLKRVH